ncbi:flagellar protein FlgN [Desulfovibrio sp. OttesenSCG-928-I05]|nr:flagellar protein FlgN [Desulfovibrio sp. OttesenSCG-928-I05]
MSTYAQIHDNLVRQWKGFELLYSLLEEEFSLLCKGDTDAVGSLEFSIHELLRQLAVERSDVKSVMQGTRLAEYADMLVPEEGDAIRVLLASIDDAEQKAARQAAHNTELSLALLDQNHALLNYLHDQVTPKAQLTYGKKGTYRESRPDAALIRGRL